MSQFLKKFIISVLNYFRLRNPFFYFKKKLRRSAYLLLNLRNKNEFLYQLIQTGAVNYNKSVDKDIIDKWIYSYGLDINNINPSEGNLAFPFFNEDLLKMLKNSNFSNLLDEYFYKLHGCYPVLQQIPFIVITYPNIDQTDFDPSKHNFPANWHTDYQSEFTVHIPFISIDSLSTHTLYSVGTHTSIFNAPKNNKNIKNIFKAFGQKTDAIMLDVDGWHSGKLDGTNPRIMLQLKYTKGNDLLTHPAEELPEKQEMQILRTRGNLKNYEKIRRCLLNDMSYIKNLDLKEKRFKIIKDNIKFYDYYI